jgi:hypothetical protein
MLMHFPSQMLTSSFQMLLFSFEFLTSMLQQSPFFLFMMPTFLRLFILLLNLQQFLTGFVISLHILLDFVLKFTDVVLIF